MSSFPNPSLDAPEEPPPSRLQKPRLLALIGGLWLLGVTVGIGLLWGHSHNEGELEDPPQVWPSESALPHHPGKPTLVCFAHPHCPCTLASLRELDRLLADVTRPMDTVIVFAKPDGVAEDWAETSVWSTARGIRGVHLFVDDGIKEGNRFAAKTSGQICLYDGDGRLLYHGGITSARGHEGDNTGRSAMQTLLSGGKADHCSPVYGCSLNTPKPQPKTGG